MDFKTAVLTCLKEKYFNFNGRATRAEYWYFFLFAFAVTFVANIISSIIPFVGTLVGLALILPSLAAGARRLHDIGKSGWFLLIGLIPLIGGLVLIYFCIQKGNDGENIYGPNPL